MILITGHQGFIGTKLCQELRKRKISYFGYDLKTGDDIRDKYQLAEVFNRNQITKVIHLAALAGVRMSKNYPKDYIDTNILGTQNIADLCKEYKVENLIFYSSSSVFGNSVKLPAEDDAPKNPISLYGITKLAGEYIVQNSGIKNIIVRPFTVYGENGRKDEVVYKWIEQIKAGKPITIYGDDRSCRGYVYLDDLVEATIKLLDYKESTALNLGGSEIVYLKDLLDIFKANMPSNRKFEIDYLDRPEEDVYQQFANTAKAKEEIGFDPEPKFKKNVKRIIYKEFLDF